MTQQTFWSIVMLAGTYVWAGTRRNRMRLMATRTRCDVAAVLACMLVVMGCTRALTVQDRQDLAALEACAGNDADGQRIRASAADVLREPGRRVPLPEVLIALEVIDRYRRLWGRSAGFTREEMAIVMRTSLSVFDTRAEGLAGDRFLAIQTCLTERYGYSYPDIPRRRGYVP